MPRANIHLVAAARPNFMKIAPLYHALRTESWCKPRLIHTGQHYDANMSEAFFRDLEMPPPDVHLEIGSGTHAEQMGGVMISYERVCLSERPDWVVVAGDVNSTAACAMVAAKMHIPVAHLEAGLRSGDRRMPEEVNRLVTDAISDVLWTPSEDADANLLREGVAAERIVRVGNIMIDSYEMLRTRIEAAETRERMGLSNRDYVVVTLHRPSNVDDRVTLAELTDHLIQISQLVQIVFAVHPRTHRRLTEFGLYERLQRSTISLSPPLGYIEFMSLVSGARAAITDSGGLQEETTYLGVPCLTLRENTERPITVTLGTNRLVRTDNLITFVQMALSGRWPRGRVPDLWDGRAAIRTAADLRRRWEVKS